MATTVRMVSEKEYLHASYEHDPELVDGQLLERPMPTNLHAFVQALLSHWFLLHRQDWSVVPLSELRTRVRPGRFRLPDVAVTRLKTFTSRPLTKAPLIAIEILSPDDRFADLQARAGDFRAMGTEHIWLIDPELRTASVWDGANWIATSALAVPGTPIHLDLIWLWEQVDLEAEDGLAIDEPAEG